MITDITKLKRFNNLLSTHSQRKHVIVLNPNGSYKNDDQLTEEIEYDKSDWGIPESISTWISELGKKTNLSMEEKILLLYQKLCNDYTYDDNLISYIKKSADDTFLLPDWYGRDVDEKWEENRTKSDKYPYKK